MKRLAAIAAALLLTACAPGYYHQDQPKVDNLSGFLTDVALARIDGHCTVAVTLKNGKVVRAHVSGDVCTEAVDGLAVARTVSSGIAKQAPAQAPQQEQK